MDNVGPRAARVQLFVLQHGQTRVEPLRHREPKQVESMLGFTLDFPHAILGRRPHLFQPSPNRAKLVYESYHVRRDRHAVQSHALQDVARREKALSGRCQVSI